MKPPTASEMDEMTREDEMAKFSIKVIEFQVPKLVAVEIFNYASGRSLGKLVMSSSEWQALKRVLMVGSIFLSGEIEIEWE